MQQTVVVAGAPAKLAPRIGLKMMKVFLLLGYIALAAGQKFSRPNFLVIVTVRLGSWQKGGTHAWTASLASCRDYDEQPTSMLAVLPKLPLSKNVLFTF